MPRHTSLSRRMGSEMLWAMRTLAWTMASSMATAARIMYFCSSIKLLPNPWRSR